MIRGQQTFEKNDQLNPFGIEIEDDRVINLPKKYNVFIPIGLLFSSGINNNTDQIAIVAYGLYKAKYYLISKKIYKILVAINLNQIKNQKKSKGVSYWVSVMFNELKNKT